MLLPRPAALAQFLALAGHRVDLLIEAIIADGLVLVECPQDAPAVSMLTRAAGVGHSL